MKANNKIKVAPRTQDPIEVGHWVAVAVGRGKAPASTYVGQVQAVNDHGIRLTLMDWVVMAALGGDLYLPWTSITASLVATVDHDLEQFVQDARDWQRDMWNSAA